MKKIKFRSPLESVLSMRALKEKMSDSKPTIPKTSFKFRFPSKPRIK